jgi:hypothetical protein
MIRNRSFWITLCLVNLCIVAFLGLILRSKILFSIPFLNYRHVLSAHSHFAFGGWAGLCLMVLLIYNLLPPERSQKKIYQRILWGIEISSLGMAFLFPVYGYKALSIFFSSSYIVVYFVFAGVFIKDILYQRANKYVRLLSISAIAALIISSLGPLGLSYILATKSGNSILYRDSIYTFLHFQYNGFFTLSIFALFFEHLVKKAGVITQRAQRFSIFLCLSVIPSLFLSLLWHNSVLFYVIAAIGCVLIIISLIYFFLWFWQLKLMAFFNSPFARTLLAFAAVSFALKLSLNVGTIFPALGDAVYGARPIIIGFLHLVFLGFLTFFILSLLIEYGYFTKGIKLIKYPFIVFVVGIFANEALLGIQGLSILFQTNSFLYNWLLWFASILLFIGAVSITLVRLWLSNLENAHEKRAIKMAP